MLLSFDKDAKLQLFTWIPKTNKQTNKTVLAFKCWIISEKRSGIKDYKNYRLVLYYLRKPWCDYVIIYFNNMETRL